MNPVIDVFDTQSSHVLRDFVTALVRDPICQALVVYNSPGDFTISATAGTATATVTQKPVTAWRGALAVQNAPGPDVDTRQYVILREDLGATVPARGDWIADSILEYGVDKVEPVPIGADLVYYLLTCTRRNP